MYMELKKLSIKNFIGDLPRIINDSFSAIETAFNKIYHEGYIGSEDMKVVCKSLEAGPDGIVSLGDVKIKTTGNTEVVSMLDLYKRLLALEKLHNIETSPVLTKKKLQ